MCYPEINHNDPSSISPSSNLNELGNRTQFNNSRVPSNDTNNDSPKLQPKKSVQPPMRQHDQPVHIQSMSHTPPQPHSRKERGRSESMISPKGCDLTVTSGDPTAHLNRRHSLHKGKNKRSVSVAGTTGKDEKPFTNAQRPSPTNRLHQRETEFSAVEKETPPTSERLQTHILNNAINENRPKPIPYDRYHPNVGSRETLVSDSRHGSSELLDTVGVSSTTSSTRHRERATPTPPPRSPRLSPVASRSNRASMARFVCTNIAD